MKQIVSNYSYSPATNVVTLTGVNIDADQLLLIVAPGVGRTMYNFASVTGTVSAGADTRVTLNASTAGLTTTSPLVIFYDDQASTQTVAGTVTANLGEPATGVNTFISESGSTSPVYAVGIGYNTANNTEFLAVNDTGNNFPVAVNNSVTIGSLPAISGTVTANVLAGQYTTITASSVSVGSNSGLLDISLYPNGAILSVEIAPTGGANGVYKLQSINEFGVGASDISVTNIFTGTSSVNISATGTYSFRKNQTTSHLRVTYVSGTGGDVLYKIRAFSESYWNQTVPISGTVTVGNSVTIGSLPAISGTVTANASNGSLTTRFGTPTTANTAFATSAVTNANRKYLLIQNVTTGSNVITVGIGFTPTTTQGIQLAAGAGITFESSYIPTGAVWVLSSVTASNFTILEA